MAGDVERREALLEWLPAIGFWLEEHEVFDNDEYVCAISTMGARREGVDVETRVVSIFRYEDGRQIERWLYPDDAAAWEAMFAAER
jgi:ketosteroid isomerase-like protein